MPTDDPSADWTGADPTAVDPSQEPTAPHRSIDYLGGREAGFTAGVEVALSSLSRVLAGDGWTGPEVARLCARLRMKASSRG